MNFDELKKDPLYKTIINKKEPETAEDIIINKEIHDNSLDVKKMDGGIDADNEIPTTIIMTNKALIKEEDTKMENDGDNR